MHIYLGYTKKKRPLNLPKPFKSDHYKGDPPSKATIIKVTPPSLMILSEVNIQGETRL